MFDRKQFIKDLCDLAEMNVPFLHQGRSVETGMDCIFAPRWGYEKQGLRLPQELAQEFDAYHSKPDGVRFLRVMRKWFQEIPELEKQPADLLLFFARKNPQHLAVLIGENEVVEAYRSEDGHVSRVLRQPLDPRRRIAAVFRIPDFA